jgi:hypothetical protein
MERVSGEHRDSCAPRLDTSRRWRCGFEPMGMACSTGPTENGECCQVAARAPCEAYGTQDCAATCSGAVACEVARLRSESQRISGDDLRTCIPIKSTWFYRQSLALNLAIFVGGGLLFCMALPVREAIFVPGPLTLSHSQILGNQLTSERCSQCHPRSHAGGSDGEVLTQEDLCLKCHAGHMPDAAMLNPHDLSPSALSSLREQWMTRFERGVSHSGDDSTQRTAHPLRSTTSTDEGIRCAVCHVEHRGPHHDLKSMTNARCQSCHQVQFAGLGNGHPEFNGYPYYRKRRIAFDHASHANQHFAQKAEVFDCSICHVDSRQVGSARDVFRSLGFEQACARCHDASLRAIQSDGWLVIQVPSLEPSDARSVEFGLNDWPKRAQYGYDGEFTSAMVWLLFGDPEMRTALQRLGHDGQLSRLNALSAEDVAAARTLARGVRRLIRSIATEGQMAVSRHARQGAESVLERELTPAENALIERLSVGLPPDIFRQVEQRWFQADRRLAGAQEELDLLSDGRTLLASASLGIEVEGTAVADDAARGLWKLTGLRHVSSGGWYLDEEVMAIRYMPTGHADPLLTAWTDFGNWMDAALNGKDVGEVIPDCARANVTRLPPGGCIECHLSTDLATPAGNFNDSWRPASQPRDVKPFTKFNHGPHLTLPLVRDCRYCHLIDGWDIKDGGAEVTRERLAEVGGLGEVLAQNKSRVARDVHNAVYQFLQKEFRPMEQAQCTACHRPGGANHGCTQCHNYHVGTMGVEWSQSGR